MNPVLVPLELKEKFLSNKPDMVQYRENLCNTKQEAYVLDSSIQFANEG